MKIILGKDNIKELQEKYTVLELDTFRSAQNQNEIIAYCLVEPTAMEQLANMPMYIDLHTNLIKNYKLKHWKYCEDAIEHLTGQWGGEVDSFYSELSRRIAELKEQTLPDTWDGVIIRED